MLNPTRKTLHEKPEAELAGYQARQVGNTCSFHVISASIHLLLNHALDPMALSDEVNRLWWRGRLMRVAPHWAVTPRRQVRIIRHLACTRGLPISCNLWVSTATSGRLPMNTRTTSRSFHTHKNWKMANDANAGTERSRIWRTKIRMILARML